MLERHLANILAILNNAVVVADDAAHIVVATDNLAGIEAVFNVTARTVITAYSARSACVSNYFGIVAAVDDVAVVLAYECTRRGLEDELVVGAETQILHCAALLDTADEAAGGSFAANN